MVTYNNKLTYLVDFGMNGNLSVGTEQGDLVTVSSNDRFAYIMQNGSVYYKFTTRDNGIFMYKSLDLISWSIMNNSQPVFSVHSNSIYAAIWNVGVAIDDNSVWHMLIECNREGDNNQAGLGYSTATLNGDLIDFNTNASVDYVIKNSGNPWIGNVPGKGLISVYGKVSAPIGNLGNEWYVSVATFENNLWSEHISFRIGSPGIHIADPHVIEFNNKLVMTVSYDQESIYELRSDLNLSQLFDKIGE